MLPNEITLPFDVTDATPMQDRCHLPLWRLTLTDGRALALRYAHFPADVLVIREIVVLRRVGDVDFVLSGATLLVRGLSVAGLTRRRSTRCGPVSGRATARTSARPRSTRHARPHSPCGGCTRWVGDTPTCNPPRFCARQLAPRSCSTTGLPRARTMDSCQACATAVLCLTSPHPRSRPRSSAPETTTTSSSPPPRRSTCSAQPCTGRGPDTGPQGMTPMIRLAVRFTARSPTRHAAAHCRITGRA